MTQHPIPDQHQPPSESPELDLVLAEHLTHYANRLLVAGNDDEAHAAIAEAHAAQLRAFRHHLANAEQELTAPSHRSKGEP